MRRILVKATQQVYQIRPNCVLPYQVGWTQDVAQGLMAFYDGSSCERVAERHGRNPMFWWRCVCALGRNSLVGSTVKRADRLPQHGLADEKHTWWYDEPVYLATTVAGGCVLGASLSRTAEANELKLSYSTFLEEARAIEPDYTLTSVNTDGWQGTTKAWTTLSPKTVLIRCFLHAMMTLRRELRKAALKREILKQLWEGFYAQSLTGFTQALNAFQDWLQKQDPSADVQTAVDKFLGKVPAFAPAYAMPEAYLTSNALDRLMDYQDKRLYAAKYLHCRQLKTTGNLLVRGLAMLWNFHPYILRTGRHSPFEDLNGFIYADNWLENLLTATSMGGHWSCHQQKTVE